jgi:GNAT superfamily N-acetyltransferase
MQPMDAPTIRLVAADHPCLDGATQRFAEELRAERRYFGLGARDVSKPFPSVIAEVTRRDGFRMALVADRRVVALARIDHLGRAMMAVAADRRRSGLGTQLMQALVERAHASGFDRIVMPASFRSASLVELGETLGASVVDLGRGRIDLIFDAHAARAPVSA